MAVDTSQFRNGLKIDIDGQPFVITYFQHVKPGKGGAFVRTKLKNLLNGRVVEKTFRSGEKTEEADIEEKSMQYLYQDSDDRIFMTTQALSSFPSERTSWAALSIIFSRAWTSMFFSGRTSP